MKYIKLGIRYNLLHLFLLVLFTCLRNINLILLSELFNFDSSLIYSILMFFAELTFGIFFFYYSKNQTMNKNEYKKYKGQIQFIGSKNHHPRQKTHFLIILFIIMMGSYFDFESFIIPTYILPKIKRNISNSLDIRIRPLFIIFTSIISRYSLEKEYLDEDASEVLEEEFLD